MAKKFKQLLNEKLMQYSNSADTYCYVVFVDGKEFKTWFNKLSDPIKEAVKIMRESDLNLIVKNYSATDETYKIAQEVSPGRLQNDIIVPRDVVEFTGHNMLNPPPHPKSWYYKDDRQGMPVHIKDALKLNEEQELQTRKTTQGKQYKKSETTLKEHCEYDGGMLDGTQPDDDILYCNRKVKATTDYDDMWDVEDLNEEDEEFDLVETADVIESPFKILSKEIKDNNNIKSIDMEIDHAGNVIKISFEIDNDKIEPESTKMISTCDNMGDLDIDQDSDMYKEIFEKLRKLVELKSL